MSAELPILPEEEIVRKKLDWELLKRLLRYLRPYRGSVVLSVALLIVLSGLALVGPYLTKIAIDRAIAAEGIARAERVRILARMGLLFLLVLALEFSLRYAQVWITQLIGQKVQYDLRMEIFAHLEKMSLRFFSKNPVGRLLTRVTSDIEALNELFTAGVVEIFGDVFLLAGIVTAMLLLDARLALTLFAVLPFLFAASLVFRLKVRDAFRDVRTRVAKMNAYLQESLVGMQVIQLFGAEGRSFARFDDRNRDHLLAHLRTVFYFAVFFPVIEVIGAAAVALLVWKGGSEVLEGTVTFGALAAFLQYTAQFFRPIRDLSEKYNILQGAMASSERIFDLLDTEPEIRAPEHPARPGPLREAIRFENVSFAYDGGDPVLRDIDLTVRRGERVALVGATGSGKSTLVTLLGRFYDVGAGAIRIDGVDLRSMDPGDLRRRIGTVLQDVFLFSGTVDRNIRLGDESIPRERMVEAARIANAERFIERLPGGYDHLLRERGAGLSAGEKQLLAFSRALAADPEIFVLDEATSNIDSETEALIQKALERILAERTSLVVAHRLSTIRNVDRIVVLHRGRIREEGTHEELLAAGGIYKTLVDLEYRNGG
ncbi:MAG: ABC transporter ATP-binding protein [Candidatus Eisenbacteria bacterium]|nr:ABC transporter ATP-binding protein [Candidatus Eisenbacteria bacterium]